MAAGLIELGHQKGHALSILSSTRQEWLLADLANLLAGGVTVGVYPTMTGPQAAYVINHADSRVLVVENQAQLDKVLPHLRTVQLVVVIDPAGVDLSVPGRISLAALEAAGDEAGQTEVDRRVAALAADDLAMLIYTSGTTGPPKGAMLTHGAIMSALEMYASVGILPEDTGFVFLPMGHVLTRIVAYMGVYAGIPGFFARSLDSVADDIASCQPTLVASVPRVFEKIYARIHAQAAASPGKKKIFDWAVKVGTGCVSDRRAGKPLSTRQRLEWAIADRLVFARLRARLGGKIRLFFTGGAPIAREILELFEAARITILEGWGMTETCAAGTLNRPGRTRPGTIGTTLPGVELKLADDGELLVRGACMFKGYYKEPLATREAHTADGWFMTGDIGKVDAEGNFSIVDRKKDLIITAAGKNVAPQNIENLMKSDPRLSQVVVIGDRKPYLVALVTVTPETRAGKSAEDLEREVAGIFAGKNPELASYERIKRFAILEQDLTIEAGELTPTLKVRRKTVSERHAARIEALYAAS